MQTLHPATKARLLELAYAPKSMKTYSDQVAQYKRFAAQAGFQLWSAESAAQWILWAHGVQGLKKKTLHLKYHAFKWGAAHEAGVIIKDRQRGDPMHLVPRVIARLPDDSEPKKHIGRHVLRQVIARLQTSQPREAAELTAWFAVAYRALLRAGETKSLRWQDIEFAAAARGEAPATAEVTLQTRPGQVFKTHTQSVKFRFTRDKADQTCAVAALWALWVRLGRPNSGEVFASTEEDARHALQRAARHVTGRARKEFGLHSLRSGGATDMERAGATLSEIMALGRWKSSAVMLYLRGGEALAACLGGAGGMPMDVRRAL